MCSNKLPIKIIYFIYLKKYGKKLLINTRDSYYMLDVICQVIITHTFYVMLKS